VEKRGNAVRLLLNKGANIEIIDTSQETVLHKVASAGDEELLFRQININAKNSSGWTALHAAAANGRGSLVRLLLGVGADPEATTLRQINALRLALESKDESSIAVLLEKGSKVDARNADGWTALQVAAADGRGLLVRALLKAGADTNATTPYGMNALDLALEGKAEQSIEALLEKGAEVELCIYSGREQIQQTIAKHGADTIVKLLIVQQAQDSAEAVSRVTVLHVAAENGYGAVVRLLSDNDFNERHYILQQNAAHQHIVKLLLLRQADVPITCNSNSTALHLSAEYGRLETTRVLLASTKSYHYEINVRDMTGQTPMYLAIVNGHPEVVRLFIEGRADHMIKDCSGRTRSLLGRRKITLDSTSIATDA